MPKVMITTISNNSQSSPSVVIVDCDTRGQADEIVKRINGTCVTVRFCIIYRVAEVLDV